MTTSDVIDRAAPESGAHVESDGSAQAVAERPWQTVVWDDPVNLMSYVTYVFQTHFGYDRAKAEELMMRVHNLGSAVVAEGGRDQMEMHVEALHGFGLWATVRQGGTS